MTGTLTADVVARRGAFELRLSLAVPAGTTAALLGPNGAGKSTAVSVLAGLIPAAEGAVRLGETVLDDPASGRFVPPERRRMGVVFQGSLLFPHLTVAENVAFGPRAAGTGRREARERAEEWMDRLDITGLARRRPAGLSGGQAQRVALARALATEPDALLLDEPLSALDVTTRAHLRRVLAGHLADFAGPRVLITHDPAEAFLLADVIHVVENGSVTQTGTPDDIRLRPRTPYAADLAGANLLSGVASGGAVRLPGFTLHVADPAEGPVLVTIRPNAVTLHRGRPEGSARNTWAATVEHVERLAGRVRVRIGAPVPLTAEVTAAAAADLHLAPGGEVWVSVKATEIGVEADGEP